MWLWVKILTFIPDFYQYLRVLPRKQRNLRIMILELCVLRPSQPPQATGDQCDILRTAKLLTKRSTVNISS